MTALGGAASTYAGSMVGGFGDVGRTLYSAKRSLKKKQTTDQMTAFKNSPEIQRYLKNASPDRKKALMSKLMKKSNTGKITGRQVLQEWLNTNTEVRVKRGRRALKLTKKAKRAIRVAQVAGAAAGFGTYVLVKRRKRKKR